MKNRDGILAYITAVLLIFGLMIPEEMDAQFIFTYEGPDTIFVDETCTGILDWGHPETPTAEPTVPGQVVIYFDISSISGGYALDGPVPAGETVIIFYEAQDNMGHFAMFGFTIYFADTIPPEFDPGTLPQDMTVECVIDDPPTNIAYSDNCESPETPVTISFMENGSSNLCEGGVIERTWTIEDFYGNINSFTQFITANPDTVPPVITGIPVDATGDCEDAVVLYAQWIEVQRNTFAAIDEGCGLMELFDNGPEPEALEDFCGDVPVDFFAVDSCSNTISVTATFTVINNVAPTIIIEASDGMTDCSSGDPQADFQTWLNTHGGADAEDDCSAVLWETNPPSLALTDICNTALEVEFIATDGCGNNTSTFASFFVQDTTAPEIMTQAQNRILSCASGDYQSELGQWLANAGNSNAGDLCTPEDSLTVQLFLNGQPIDSSGIVAAIEDSIQAGCVDDVIVGGILYNNVLALINLEFGWMDACGNMAFTSAYFGITDSGPPVFLTQPSDTIITCAGGENLEESFAAWYNSTGFADVSDDCGSLNISGEPSFEDAWNALLAGLDTACATGVSVSVLFSAADFCNNMVDADNPAEFMVIDSIVPVLISQATDLNLVCDPQAQSELQIWLDSLGGAEATDNCEFILWSFQWETADGDTLTGMPDEGPYPQIGNFGCNTGIDITFIAMDFCGNAILSSAQFIITDTSAPQFSPLPVNLTVSCESIPDTADFEVTDNCEAIQILLSFTDSLLPNPDTTACANFNYTILRKWTAEDACGNIAVEDQQITVMDITAPAFDPAPDITIACGDLDNPEVTGSPTNVQDNCDSDLIVAYSDVQMGMGCDYIVERTWYIEDACGNLDSALQMITVSDTMVPVPQQLPSDLILACDEATDEMDITNQFNTWVASGGGANFIDNCGNVSFFVAEPGSYDLEDAGTFPGTPLSLPSLENCASAQNGLFVEVVADVVFYDDCGNAGFEQVRFAVEDLDAPVFLNCLPSQIISTETDACEANVTIYPPLVDEGCLAEYETIEMTRTVNITSIQPGSANVPVNDFVVNFNPVPRPPDVPIGPVDLLINLENVDANEPTEYFNVYGENGEFIGRTNNTSQECGSNTTAFSIQPEMMYGWIIDGQVFFTFEAHVPEGAPGDLAINDICNESQVVVAIKYVSQSAPNLSYSYILDGGDTILQDNYKGIDLSLLPGSHTIEFFVADCSGNIAQCATILSVTDLVPPVVECPDDITTTAAPGLCFRDLTVPEPRIVDDNCGFTGDYQMTVPANQEDALITFSFDEEIGNFLADDITLVFPDVAGEATGDAMLHLEYRGDVEGAEEFFRVLFDEILIGTTEAGQGNIEAMDCEGVSRAQFGIARENFNELAQDGNIILELRTFRDFMSPPDGPESGINPCEPGSVQQDGDTDSISYLRATLSYPTAKPQVYAEGATTFPLTPFPVDGTGLVLSFNAGETNLFYVLQDAAGNADTCNINVTVNDIEAPEAVCQPGILYVHPSGTIPGQVTLSHIDGGTSDNCGIDSIDIMPSVFPCDSAGTTQQVELIVWDAFGNADSCTAAVRIETQILEPLYEVGICENDTLKLFANVPQVPGNPYTFFWSGPGGFVSNIENPIIPNVTPNATGTYVLEVTGINGCVSTGTVEVVVEDLNAPSLEADRDSICIGESVILNATDYTIPVEYMWYRGTAPNGLLLQPVTINPTFTVTPPAAGTYSYYVIVESAACTSNPSENVIITVFDQPVAEVAEPIIDICEGESILLEAVSGGPEMSYLWTGPNGFLSNMQNPPAIPDATIAHAGFYALIVYVGDCASEPVFVEVIVKPKPETPVISGNSAVCEDGTLVLMVNNVDDADQYIWFHPNGSSIPTPGNTFVLENVDHADEGGWTVEAELDGCRSNISQPFFVDIDSALIISIAQVPEVCEGDSVTLQAPVIPGANYLWDGPGGFTSMAANPSLVPENGTYNLTVTSAEGCISTASTVIETVEPVVITAISNNGGDCANGVNPVSFFVTLNMPDDGSFIYEWTGPGGFTSAEPEPTIDSLHAGLNGLYTLVVYRGDCPSEPYTDSINVTNSPQKPVINGEDTVCTGNDIILDVPGHSGVDVLYAWTTPEGNIDKVNDSILVINNANTDLSGEYYLQVVIEGCPSPFSDTFFVEVIPPLMAPEIQALSAVCEGDTIFLTTPFIESANYMWSGPAGFTSSLQNPFIYPAEPGQSGEYELVISIQNCSSEPSDPFIIEVVPMPQAPAVLPFEGSVCLDDPMPVEVCFDPNAIIPGATYFWFVASTGESLGTSGNNNCLLLEDFSMFEEGENGVVVQTEIDGCRSENSQVILIPMYIFPDETSEAGPDQTLCQDDELMMMASGQSLSTGLWTGLTGDPAIADPGDPNTTVTGLGPGDNLFVWSLSFESCIDFSTDTVVVETEITPDLQVDTVHVPFGQTVQFNAVVNDLLPGSFTVTIAENPNRGNSLHQGDGEFIYTPNLGFVGEDMMVYRVCNTICPEQCDESIILFRVGDEDDCFIPSIFTPNNDGVNDRLIIPCLESERYPGNRIIVFNEWGDAVFEAQPYDNTWDGKYKGTDLPVATYFMIVDFGDGSPVRKSFIIIDR